MTAEEEMINKLKGKIVIRFDGPPSHESGRFIEVEQDGESISRGDWIQDGNDWLLVFNDEQCAYDLLAVMHKDGGHYIGKVGFEQSCKDAQNIYYKLRVEVEKLRNTLNYYADKDTYKEQRPMIITDKGSRARDVLGEINKYE